MGKNNKTCVVVGSNPLLDVHGLRSTREWDHGFPVEVGLHERYKLDGRARFAAACIERWGLVVAEDNGEDSAGRAKVRRATPEEVVDAACDCAERAFTAFAERGWLVPVPSIESMFDQIEDAENEAGDRGDNSGR